MDKIVKLEEQYFLGKGRHKKTFIIPDDDSRCIKVAYSNDGTVDMVREIEYRALRDKQGKESKMLPAYYGKISTDKGQGYIFERVMDYDGNNSMTLENYIEDLGLFERNFEQIVKLVLDFKQLLFAERLLTMGIFPENILVQKVAESTWEPRLINDMGCANFIRLEYYFDYFALKKINRRWKGFLKTLEKRFYSPFTIELIKRVS